MAVSYVVKKYRVSERRACRALKVNRSVHRYKPIRLPDEDEIRHRIIELVCEYGRIGYRMVTYMLRNEGILINHKRVERIWREEGLKLPKKQKKRRRLFLNDGSCIRLRAERKNHVWSYDFVSDRTHPDGRQIRFLNIIDEHTHECLASVPRRSWKDNDVIELLAKLMITHGVPEYLRSDNSSEFTARAIRQWLQDVGTITAYIVPGSPWENGFIESFNSRMRDEFLNGELFGNLKEAEVLAGLWVNYYNTIRPHSSLGGKTPAGAKNPAPQATIPLPV